MQQYPEGIPYFLWLFNKDDIRFKGAFFYWIFAERLAKLITGYWGTTLLVVGFINKSVKEDNYFYFSWLVAMLAYLFIVARGNVQHDYYQVLLLPIICIYLAKGFNFIWRENCFNKYFSRVTLFIIVVFMFMFSWYQVRDYFNVNNPAMVEAGRRVDQLADGEAKVIAPYGGDTAFLYQTNRRGWPVGIEIGKMIDLGASIYVNTNFGPETEWLEKNYCVIEKTTSYIIINLLEKCQ